MANANNPFGFEVFKVEGKECRIREYVKDTSAAIYMGDVVWLESDGEVAPITGSGTILGVAAEYVAAAGTSIKVYDDPEIEFVAQHDGIYAAADVGQNVDVAVVAGNATLKQSNHGLDTSSMGTESTKQFKIIGLLDRGVNAVGSYAICRVKPNNHLYNAGVTGV